MSNNHFKQYLTPEQSQRLIELGVDPRMASIRRTVGKETGVLGLTAIKSEYHIFTLTDILSLLPKEIIFKGDKVQLQIFWSEDKWVLKYDNVDSSWFHCEHSPELIDALFELLVWCITHKYLKL